MTFRFSVSSYDFPRDKLWLAWPPQGARSRFRMQTHSEFKLSTPDMSYRAIQLITPVAYRALLSSSRPGARILALDGSWYMPTNPRDAFAEYKAERLSNARFFDVDGIKDKKSQYPHMLPSVKEFNAAMSQLGIHKNDKLVVYDKVGNFSAPRVAWTLQTFGHENVFLLNNFPLYQKYAYPLDTSAGSLEYEPSNYESSDLDSNAVLSFEQYVDIVSNEQVRKGYTILDARSYDRYTGKEPEPRPGLPSGHAPGTKCLPFTRVLDEDKSFLSKEKLVELFEEVGVDPEKPIIVSCGTGVTACVLKAALDAAGYNKKGIQVYDGSWTEYAQRAGPELIIKGAE